MPSPELRSSFRTLLLPVDPGHEGEALEAVDSALADLEIDEQDRPDYIRLLSLEWRRDNEAPANLGMIVSRAVDVVRPYRLEAGSSEPKVEPAGTGVKGHDSPDRLVDVAR